MTSVDPTLLRGREVSHLHPTIFARDYAEFGVLSNQPIARADRVGGMSAGTFFPAPLLSLQAQLQAIGQTLD